MIVYIHRSSISISMKVSLGGSSIANVGFKVSSGRTMLLLLFPAVYQETIILEVVFDSLSDSNFQLVPGSFTNHHHHQSSDVITIHYSMSSPNCQNYSGTSKDESSMELEFQFRKRSSLDYNYKTSLPADGLHPN